MQDKQPQSTTSGVYDLLGTLIGLVIALIALAIVADLFLRRIDIGGIGGLQEMVEYALFSVVFLGAPWLVRRGGHIRIELLSGALDARGQKRLSLCVNIFCLGVCLLLVWYGAQNLLDSYAFGSAQRQYFIIYEWWLLCVFVLSTALCALEFVRSIVNHMTSTTSETEV